MSFKQVLDWLANATQKPVELAGLINELRTFVPFYRDIAHIRNAIVHKGADAFAVLADPSIHGRLGFGILVKKRDRLMTLGSMPTSLFEIGVIDLKIYLGLAIGFMINFLNRFSASVMSILNGREIICLEESVHPFFPSTMAKLIAVAGLKNSLHMMKNFSCPGTVPQMIAAGRPLAEILKLVNDMEPIRVSKMKYVGAYAPGSTSAIKFMTEARGYLELQLHT